MLEQFDEGLAEIRAVDARSCGPAYGASTSNFGDYASNSKLFPFDLQTRRWIGTCRGAS